MPFSLLPTRVYSSIDQLEPDALQAAGVRLILSDLDNTISPYTVAEPPETVFAWKRALEAHQITLFI